MDRGESDGSLKGVEASSSMCLWGPGNTRALSYKRQISAQSYKQWGKSIRIKDQIVKWETKVSEMQQVREVKAYEQAQTVNAKRKSEIREIFSSQTLYEKKFRKLSTHPDKRSDFANIFGEPKVGATTFDGYNKDLMIIPGET